jgi:hypothetical protein
VAAEEELQALGRHTVVYNEPPVDARGKPPASVFLAGRQDVAYRIGLVMQAVDDD